MCCFMCASAVFPFVSFLCGERGATVLPPVASAKCALRFMRSTGLMGRYELLANPNGVVSQARNLKTDTLHDTTPVPWLHLAEWQVEALREDFRRWQKLQHRNIVELLDVIDLDKCILIVMSTSGGTLLSDHLTHHGILNESTSHRFFKSIVAGLSYCSSMGMYHCNLHPDCILMDTQGTIKVGGFGFCHLHPITPYMAPELAMSTAELMPALAAAVDIWSLGMILYEMLSGQLPPLDQGHEVMKMPKYFSQILVDLIQQMLRPVPEARCTLDDIIAHLWFQSNQQPWTPTSPQKAMVAMTATTTNTIGNSTGSLPSDGEFETPPNDLFAKVTNAMEDSDEGMGTPKKQTTTTLPIKTLSPTASTACSTASLNSPCSSPRGFWPGETCELASSTPSSSGSFTGLSISPTAHQIKVRTASPPKPTFKNKDHPSGRISPTRVHIMPRVKGATPTYASVKSSGYGRTVAKDKGRRIKDSSSCVLRPEPRPGTPMVDPKHPPARGAGQFLHLYGPPPAQTVNQPAAGRAPPRLPADAKERAKEARSLASNPRHSPSRPRVNSTAGSRSSRTSSDTQYKTMSPQRDKAFTTTTPPSPRAQRKAISDVAQSDAGSRRAQSAPPTAVRPRTPCETATTVKDQLRSRGEVAPRRSSFSSHKCGSSLKSKQQPSPNQLTFQQALHHRDMETSSPLPCSPHPLSLEQLSFAAPESPQDQSGSSDELNLIAAPTLDRSPRLLPTPADYDQNARCADGFGAQTPELLGYDPVYRYD